MARVYLTRRAEKDLRKIGLVGKKRLQKKIFQLKSDFLDSKKLRGEFKGLYSLKVWPYRVLYRVQKKNIEIVRIVHRQGVYK